MGGGAVPAAPAAPSPMSMAGLEPALTDLGPSIPWAGLLATSLGNFRTTTERTTAAFVRGDTIGGMGGVAEMIGSVVPLLSVFSGPASIMMRTVLGGFLSIIGAVLSSLEPQRNQLRKELDAALDRLHVKLIVDELRAAEDDFATGTAILSVMDN